IPRNARYYQGRRDRAAPGFLVLVECAFRVFPCSSARSVMLKQLFAKKSLETLLEEARGENRLRRILGPVGLTSLGVGAIIGAGIFVMTGRVAANAAGPAI